MLLRLLAASASAAALCGCPGPTDLRHPPCEAHVAGDAAAPLELEPIGLQAGKAQVLHDGDALPLTVPAQGGYVLYAGARARNLMACGAAERAQLLDADTGQALTNLDQRTLDFSEAADGYFQPWADALQFDLPNIPACPDALGKGIAGRTAQLQVVVTDAQGKSATATVLVVPTCPAGDARCACVCGPNYAPGKC